METFWTVVLVVAPLWLWLLLAVVWPWWGRRRRAVGHVPPRRWPSVVMVGGEQARGQAALVSEDVSIGMEVEASGDVWRVTDLEAIGNSGARRAWLLNVTERDRIRIDLAARRRVMEEAVSEIDAIVTAAVTPFFGAKWTPDMPAILNHYVRVALCQHADRLRLLRYAVKSHADLPPRAAWPEVRSVSPPGAMIGQIRWDSRPMAEMLAARSGR